MASRTLSVVIAGDARGAKQAFSELEGATGGVEGKLARLSAGMKDWGDNAVRLGKSLALNVSLPIVALGTLAYRELADSQKVAAQTEAAIRSTGGAANVTAADVDRLASALMRKSGIDDEVIASGENLLLTFTKIRNEAGKGNDIFDRATKAALDLSVAFGTDMHSSAIMLGKALNDPIAGLTSLGRAGVQFTDDQKATIRALVESGQVLEAQKIILGELETQVGGSAEAYGKTLPGQIDRAKNALLNSSALILATAAPALEHLASASEKVAAFLADLPQPAQEAIAAFAAVAAAAGPVTLIAGKIAQGGAVIARGFSAIAAGAETIAVKTMYAIDALKAMSTAQLVGLGAMGLAIGGLAVLSSLLIMGRGRYEEITDAAKKWAEVQLRNQTASLGEAGALVSLQQQQSVLKAKISETQEALDRLKSSEVAASMSSDELRNTRQGLNEEMLRYQQRHDELTPKIENLAQKQKEAELAERARRDAILQVAQGTTQLADASAAARNAIMQLQSQVLAASGGEIGYQQSLINREKAQADLNKAIEEHGPLSQEAAAATLAAQQADLQAASAALGVDDAYTALKTTLLETPEAYDAEIRKLEEAKAKHPEVAAAIQQQIDKLIWLKGAIEAVPNEKHTRYTADSSNFDAVTANVKYTLGQMGGFVRAAIAGVTVEPEGAGAEGAIVNRPTLALIGEAGPEALVPLDQTAGNDPLSTFGGGGGASPSIVVNVGGSIVTERQLDEVIATSLARWQRHNGRG